MIKEIREKLIEVARLKATMNFVQLNDQLQLGFDLSRSCERKEFGRMLSELSSYEHDKDRPLLSSLVIHKGKYLRDRDLFFKTCEELGFGQWKELKDNKEFDSQCKTTCHEFWRNEELYKEHKDDCDIF